MWKSNILHLLLNVLGGTPYVSKDFVDIPLKHPVPWTCYLCEFSSNNKNDVQDDLQVAHLLTSPSPSRLEPVTTTSNKPIILPAQDPLDNQNSDVPQNSIAMSPVTSNAVVSEANEDPIHPQPDRQSLESEALCSWSSSSNVCVSRNEILISNELAILPLPLNNPLRCPFPSCDVHLTATVWTVRKALF